MNPQHLDALVTATREAIEAAQSPLLKRLEDLERERVATFEALTSYHTVMSGRVTSLESRAVPTPYDDSVLVARLDSISQSQMATAKAVSEWSAPPAYDDAELREQICRLVKSHTEDTEAILTRIPKAMTAYDDHKLRVELDSELKEIRQSIPTAYDDSGLAARLDDLTKTVEALSRKADNVPSAIESALLSIPRASPYDDTAIASAIDDLRGEVEEVAKGLGKVPTSYDDTDLREMLRHANEKVQHLTEVAEHLKSQPGPEDGRDALDIEILPEIDLGKSYSRGAYAKHDGGLWRSFQKTSSLRGWECLIDGVKSITPHIQGKTLTVTVVRSSGEESTISAFIPLQVYRGVWTEGDYLEGDTATWAGSLWHCNQNGTKSKPGDGSPDWTLAVKKGRDASAPVKI